MMAWRKKTWGEEVEEAVQQIELIPLPAAPVQYSIKEIEDAFKLIESENTTPRPEPAGPPPIGRNIDSDDRKKPTAGKALRQFRLLLSECFNDRELHNLCFDMEVPDSEVTYDPREIILYFRRMGRTKELVDHVRKLRPHRDWPDISFNRRESK
jgi:hypothetical protein